MSESGEKPGTMTSHDPMGETEAAFVVGMSCTCHLLGDAVNPGDTHMSVSGVKPCIMTSGLLQLTK